MIGLSDEGNDLSGVRKLVVGLNDVVPEQKGAFLDCIRSIREFSCRFLYKINSSKHVCNDYTFHNHRFYGVRYHNSFISTMADY